MLVVLEIEEPDARDANWLASHRVPVRRWVAKLRDHVGSRLIEGAQLRTRAHIRACLVGDLRNDRLRVRRTSNYEVDVLVALLKPPDNAAVDLIGRSLY